MKRSFKAQVQEDVKNVFLSLDDFAEPETIRYWKNGPDRSPLELHIPIVVEEEGNMNSVWNKNKAQQRAGNEPILFQVDKTIWCALEDFGQKPRKNRLMRVGNQKYGILSVEVEEGMLKIELRRLEE